MSSPEIPQLPRPESAPIIVHEAIPEALKRLPQWVCWHYVDRGPDKKPDKRPLNPHNLHNAGVKWPNTWSNFPHAYTVYLMWRARGADGIGFVLTADDPFVGLDLDQCIEDGILLPWAQDVLDQVSSYTEISPSGSGLRILVNSPEFTESHRRDHLEIYSRDRFLTLTGNHLPGTPNGIQAIDLDILATFIPDPTSVPTARPVGRIAPDVVAAGNDELWKHIFQHDRFGDQHRRRFIGDTSLDGGDHSLTVIRLLNTLARWTRGDAAQMRAMMSLSPLANDKWWSKRGSTDWLDCQIADAIAYTRDRA